MRCAWALRGPPSRPSETGCCAGVSVTGAAGAAGWEPGVSPLVAGAGSAVWPFPPAPFVDGLSLPFPRPEPPLPFGAEDGSGAGVGVLVGGGVVGSLGSGGSFLPPAP